MQLKSYDEVSATPFIITQPRKSISKSCLGVVIV